MFHTQVASPIAGRLSDAMVEKWKARRKGTWVPEDRLRAVLVGGLLVPLSVCLSGLITTYIAGTSGLVLNLLCFFMNGIGASCKLVYDFFTFKLRIFYRSISFSHQSARTTSMCYNHVAQR